MNIRELAEKIGASSIEFATGDEDISCATAIEDGAPGAVTFIGNPHYEKFLSTTKATAVIVSEYLSVQATNGGHVPALIRVKSPYEGFARALEVFQPKRELLARGVHPTAIISKDAVIAQDVNIGAHAYIGERVTIGRATNISPGAVIGADTTIGEECDIHPNAVIYDHTEIGNRVVIGPGTVIAFDGFGYVPMGNGSYRKIPQIGNVVIEDDVEIGANTTIDRATVAETRIRKGVKIDNLVQIAHNVDVGDNSVIAAQAGVAGSTKLGRSNILAGQSGMTGHITTVDQVIVGAQSGVSKSITKPGSYFGYPAKGHREALKLEGALRSLPELIERVKKLEEQLSKEAA